MDDWFTVEKIDSDTFVISEYRHWEETHCYLLCAEKGAVLIDTGLGVADIGELIGELTKLSVTVATTHAHWDHIGGHGCFDSIAVHEAEREWINGKFPLSVEAVKAQLLRIPCSFPDGFSVDNYSIYQGGASKMLCDGDILDLGNRKIEVIHTPGHSPGHCCFYEKDRQYLYCGDLMYYGCLDAFYPSTDPVLYRKSVKRVAGLNAGRLLPAHHRIPENTELMYSIENAFDELYVKGLLIHGAGLFDYGDFQIHI